MAIVPAAAGVGVAGMSAPLFVELADRLGLMPAARA
jgi:hypothetical protein